MNTVLAIQVLQQDIDQGKHNCSECPIALATSRALRNRGYAFDFINLFVSLVMGASREDSSAVADQMNPTPREWAKNYDFAPQIAKPAELLLYLE